MSAEFLVAETDSFRKLLEKPHFAALYPKITDYVYPQLRQNPFFGLNIKKLKGDLSGIYRYRIGGYRLFYTIKTDNTIVFILSVKDRKESY